MLIVLYVIKTMFDIFMIFLMSMCVRYAVNQCLPIQWE